MEHRYHLEQMRHTCVAFGEFDGLHRGHLAILAALVAEAGRSGRTAAMVSCYAPLKSQQAGSLTTEEEKAYLLKETGLSVLVSFNIEENIMAKETFIQEIIIDQMGAEVIVTGANNQELELLKMIAAAAGVQVLIVDTKKQAGEELTSGLVRRALLASDMEKVASLCDGPYRMLGEVIHGKALGRTVGMPTANLCVSDFKLKPPSGVYAVTAKVRGASYRGLTNIGLRPSVDDLPVLTIETYLIEFSGEIYGEQMVIEVYAFLREIQKFQNLEEVRAQVQKDLDFANTFLIKP